VRKPYSFVFLGMRSSQVFTYVIESMGSIHLILEKGFHKGDSIKKIMCTVVVLTGKLSYTALT
jgi:hypothetical protein